jgi:TatD DNase family protein
MIEYTNTAGLIDSHFHSIYMQKKEISIQQHFKDLITNGFIGGLDIGVEPGDTKERKSLLQNFPQIRIASGLYPGLADDIEKGTPLSDFLKILENDIQVYSPSAIGEIGLDWYWDYGTRKIQKELVSAQIQLANSYNLPIVIHNREADNDLIELLKNNKCLKGGIIHCFSSNWETAKKLLDLDFFISFAGNVTFKNNNELRNVMEKIPASRLLLETDSPYLSPVPRRGKINTPANMPYIYNSAALVRNTSLELLINQVKENFFAIIP